MSCPDPRNYVLTNHARWEMERRGITEDEVDGVLTTPEQWWEIRSGRRVYQSRLTFGEPPKVYLVRVFVDVHHEPFEVVTVYRTSKVEKYWR
ncbi:MAG: DUF4258 domain-containing protein [Chloroflexi bacterium]|nr:DUF4258 domain-containing protein [Chloroflexota bacterium]